jgi:hypothetical protein
MRVMAMFRIVHYIKEFYTAQKNVSLYEICTVIRCTSLIGGTILLTKNVEVEIKDSTSLIKSLQLCMTLDNFHATPLLKTCLNEINSNLNFPHFSVSYNRISHQTSTQMCCFTLASHKSEFVTVSDDKYSATSRRFMLFYVTYSYLFQARSVRTFVTQRCLQNFLTDNRGHLAPTQNCHSRYFV